MPHDRRAPRGRGATDGDTSVPTGHFGFFELAAQLLEGRLATAEPLVAGRYYVSSRSAEAFLKAAVGIGVAEEIVSKFGSVTLMYVVARNVEQSAADAAHAKLLTLSQLFHGNLQGDEAAIGSAFAKALADDKLHAAQFLKRRPNIALSPMAQLEALVACHEPSARQHGQRGIEIARARTLRYVQQHAAAGYRGRRSAPRLSDLDHFIRTYLKSENPVDLVEPHLSPASQPKPSTVHELLLPLADAVAYERYSALLGNPDKARSYATDLARCFETARHRRDVLGKLARTYATTWHTYAVHAPKMALALGKGRDLELDKFG